MVRSEEARVVRVDYGNPRHARDLVELLDLYARDPAGGGSALDELVKRELVARLAQMPHAFSVLCYMDELAVGLANGFFGFSTFAARPVANVHDIVVRDGYRRHGLSRRLLEKIEALAVEHGCCKLTLEVLQGNRAAQAAYRKFGFAGYALDPAMGEAMFWQKRLDRGQK